MSDHVYKRHNKTLLLYHLVFPAKYRKKVITRAVEETLHEICDGISLCYEIKFLEIGSDEDHIHFLIQSVPNLSITRIVTILKSITAREIYKTHPEVKKLLWGGNFWTSGYYVNTVGSHGTEEVIKNYVKEHGGNYKKIYSQQLSLFDDL
ncbi:IS200/IS605 family transposase [Candidatus Latescibacterota bacterium]